ncbi:MAG: HD domain-containing protein [Thaumarchaeota archaeon]|nr:HD domain-containing protein [Nitrososphaerota archaeon]
MKPEDCTSLITFLRYAGALKKEIRRGWILKVNVRDAESVADHSWRTALLALIVAGYKGLDVERAMGMALIHDVGESVIGDLTPEDADAPRKGVLEDEAVQRILSTLPEVVKTVLSSLWEEYKAGASSEARLVRELDKVEMALQAEEYRLDGYDASKLKEFKEYARGLVKDRDLVDLLGIF